MITIPANLFASVSPSVLAAGGTGIAINGLGISTSTRVPIGQVLPFATGAAVTAYFGAGSPEDIFANGGVNLGGGYFGGFLNSNKLPGLLFFTQYPQNAVGAYLRGGNISALTLAQLQAISGSLNVIVDGYPFNAASVNLAASTSFSSAAGIIQTQLNAADPSEASFTGSIGASFTGVISTTTLTISAIAANERVNIGDTVVGSGVTAGTKITAFVGGTGGNGTYTVNISQTVGSESMTTTSNVLDATTVASGTLAVGQTVTGSGVAAGSVITALGTGTGGTGTYTLSGAPQTVASEAMASEGTPITVTFDSVSGGFIIASGITGAPSTMAFATGTIAATLLLTSATGAVLSQGAAAAVPATFMGAAATTSTGWTTFATLFDPDGGSGNTVKQAFAAWKNSQNDRYAYVCWDTDVTPTNTVPASASLGQILGANGDSGTCLLDGDPASGWTSGTGTALAAFVMGAAAAIDFTQKDGRISFAAKQQAGLQATVTTGIIATNLGGNPQAAPSLATSNGYNYFGAIGSATGASFTWFQRGQVTGAFKWLDSYINQIWLNAGFQAALLNLLSNARSIPYTPAGRTLIEAALSDQINQGLNFGAFGPGVLSSAQIAEVNNQAGANISDALQAQGYYLQILPAIASVRSARTTPPCTFWYIDNGSVQSFNLASVALI